MDLVEDIRKRVGEANFPRKGAALVVAVSGGVDSMVLLHALLPLAGHFDWKLVVAHLDHGLRAESYRDAEFVKNIASSLGLKFVGKKVAVGRKSQLDKLTIEEAGRKARYHFFNQVADKHEADIIVTAHTADDQVETVVMNFLRGGLVRALSGMREVDGRIWRPFLGISKDKIEAFAKQHNIRYREDKSNLNTDYTRNKIRHKLLPVMAKINPAVREVLGRNAQSFADLEDFLNRTVSETFKRIGYKRGSSVTLRRPAFDKLHSFLQDELIMYAVEAILGTRQGFKRVHLQEVRRVVESPKSTSKKQLPSKLLLAKTYDKITISRYRPKKS